MVIVAALTDPIWEADSVPTVMDEAEILEILVESIVFAAI
jgi:hypothetical protein